MLIILMHLDGYIRPVYNIWLQHMHKNLLVRDHVCHGLSYFHEPKDEEVPFRAVGIFRPSLVHIISLLVKS